MMHGIVDRNCEATIRLVVGNTDSQKQMIDAVICLGQPTICGMQITVEFVLKWLANRRLCIACGHGSAKALA